MSRFDFSHPPFDTLTPGEQQTLEKHADIQFFAEEECLLGPSDRVDALYVVLKGSVREMAGDEVITLYRERDTFDARAMVAGQTPHRFVVHEEALLYTLPRDVVLALTEQNPRFGAYFYASVSEKFGSMAQRAGNRELQTLLTATVARRRQPHPGIRGRQHQRARSGAGERGVGVVALQPPGG